ncbi:MAG: copper resistance protein B [Brevundimonas sp.]|uniref:copper resistance protein B n=1 Tax=Brevundimonas sp. TaxID=1871086 RepID=UPI002719FCD9|nr:copper resistance protein B [Brevundimonas sp.]MDO9588141.1 copper resistance protein B [Brevundimonas sp.]MDZ4108884.1 copper resistance protein B [Brevundimonas sp.]
MNRLTVALVPLLLAAGAVSAQAQDPHAGHTMPAASPRPQPATPAPDPHAGHQMPARPAAQDPHAGHVMPPAQTLPAADPHAGHRMPAEPQVADPHAGHDMSTMAPSEQPDPPAGHAMATRSPAQDPHAGHDMSTTTSGPPDVPTSADNPGRPPEDPVPTAALSGPAHAADLVFGAEAMAAARRTLMRENGDIRTTAVVIDRLESGFGDRDDSWLWDVQGWSGGDINRFWWKSEGEGDVDGGLEDAEFQALYSRAVTPFWDIQAGVRQDFRPDGEDTTHLVLGFQGLAPHWWEIDAAAFLSTNGDLTARVEAEYDQRITQRLILQPRLEIDLSASDIPELEIGSGLSSVEAGLRLRYEFRKEFAPYVGIEWSRSFGDTADHIEARGGDPEDTRFVVGLKAWF